MSRSVNITINVYRSGGEWFGARWFDREYDGCDPLDCDSDADDDEAIECAREMRLSVDGPREVNRVADK